MYGSYFDSCVKVYKVHGKSMTLWYFLIAFCSCNRLRGVNDSWYTLLIRDLYAANLCSTEQLDIKCIATDVWLLKIITIIIHIQLFFLIIVTLLLQSTTQTLLCTSVPSISLQMAEKGWNMSDYPTRLYITVSNYTAVLEYILRPVLLHESWIIKKKRYVTSRQWKPVTLDGVNTHCTPNPETKHSEWNYNAPFAVYATVCISESDIWHISERK